MRLYFLIRGQLQGRWFLGGGKQHNGNLFVLAVENQLESIREQLLQHDPHLRDRRLLRSFREDLEARYVGTSPPWSAEPSRPRDLKIPHCVGPHYDRPQTDVSHRQAARMRDDLLTRRTRFECHNRLDRGYVESGPSSILAKGRQTNKKLEIQIHVGSWQHKIEIAFYVAYYHATRTIGFLPLG